MATTLNPYISFKSEAAEALAFYQSILGGELKTNKFSEFGTEGPDGDLIMHGQLTTDAGYTIMASDTPSFMEYNPGASITISIFGDEGDQLRAYFAGLAEGGAVNTPLEMQMWGDEYGQLVDKYGIGWMVNITKAE